MNPIHVQNSVRPFANDCEYLEAEFRWVKARCRYLGARMDAEHEAEKEHIGLTDGDDPQAGWPGEARTKVSSLGSAETTLRETIDARLVATRAAGSILGLDKLVQQHDLDATERTVLLLAAMPAVGLELYDVLGRIGSFGFALMSITPELVATFAGLGLEGRLRLREQLGPAGKLVTGGLVEVDLPGGERCQDFPTASVFIQNGAFEVIVGTASLDVEGICPCCGHPAQPENRG